MARADATMQWPILDISAKSTAPGSKILLFDPATRSNTSVCLKFTAMTGSKDGAAFAKAVAKRLDIPEWRGARYRAYPLTRLPVLADLGGRHGGNS